MSLYYFHVEEGGAASGPLAIEFPDVDAARAQAVTWFTALSRVTALGDGAAWQMRVTDEAGHHSFSLEFASVAAMTTAVRDCRAMAEHAFIGFVRPHEVTVKGV